MQHTREPMRILLIEDNLLLGEGIITGLSQFQYSTIWAKNGHEADNLLIHEKQKFDIIILDLGLPGDISGIDVLKKIRCNNINTPVIILTARGSIEDRVLGLDAGADDYLVKPFDLDELSARIRSLHRRSLSSSQVTLHHEDIVMDPAAHVVYQNNCPVLVSRREFTILQKLLENTGRVITREQLNQTLYGWGENVDSNALEVHIHNLRKRFGSHMIRTIRGVGYMVEKRIQRAKAV